MRQNPSRHRRQALVAIALSCSCSASLALAAGQNDARARAKGDQAIDEHYLAMNFKQAEAGLKSALELCKGSKCSKEVEASLRRDLASVYIAGMKQPWLGKQQMKQALKLDPKLRLNPDLTTDQVKAIFVEMGGVDGAAEPEPESESESEVVLLEEEPEPEETPTRPKTTQHWVSGAFQIDSMLHKQTSEACSAADAYFCYNDAGERYGFHGEPALDPTTGNKVDGGLALATMRLMAGYDYRLLSTLSVGARLGFAFHGAPVDNAADTQSFLPLHLEFRAQRLFADDPFAPEAFTPYVSLSAGMAQVDSGKSVAVYQVDNPQKIELTGYRKTGKGFFGIGAGTYYAVNETIAPFAELMFMQMLPVSAQVFALRFGAAYALDL